MNDRILLSSPHMGGNEQKYVKKAFDDNWIAPLGENVDKFEQAISDFAGSKGGASVTSSGTAAIHLALRLLNVGKGDIVFAPSFTFIATINPILYQSAIPVFIDSEPETWNMSPDALERAMVEAEYNNQLPKAIIVVDLYGQMAKYDEILTIANRYNVPVIEDSAESLGSLYKGKNAGTMGDIGIFSFNGNKIITTSGGGALIADNKHFVDHSRFLATQARDAAPYYQHTEIGYNYRLSNVSAGIGCGQMEVLPERISRRKQIYKKYLKEFTSINSIKMMPDLDGFEPNRWLSTLTLEAAVSIDDVVMVINKLNEYNIETRSLWKPMHMQPLFSSSLFYEHIENQISVSETLFNKGLCLPSGTNMNDEQLNYVVEKVKEVVK
ncbi:aminotransferase class I/II-fold pyridoxal phosphate-dependent enzyme [Enterococcus hulanensis]|uniref:aminotransferase class I/II-fold pyridoxal phosphate-dependent enzyme n=1 Tax=Enterococcus hulanensis TaxID=2559929 RepID=UPI002890CCC0|nr:aminotransferase class I/II-fold pyridoxal phosphate-dependent enzyme [Enterococcus hulanensis]MDT2660863.1 aminotransferase class I/II-fold pyridoxal phosphate-dependent enzyme [Enterococcus hulanensis]